MNHLEMRYIFHLIKITWRLRSDYPSVELIEEHADLQVALQSWIGVGLLRLNKFTKSELLATIVHSDLCRSIPVCFSEI